MKIEDYTDPFEYPDWRWTRVRSLIKENKEPDPRDDKYIHRAFRFTKETEACDGSDSAVYSLSLKHRDISKAMGLHNNTSARRCYVEALALCADTDEEKISKYMGETYLSTRYYLKLFFDVRDKLDSPGYICSRIMEPAVLRAIQDCKDPDIAWKLVGMFGGADAVKMCWELRDSSAKVKDYFKKAGMSVLFKDFAVGTHLRPVNRFNTELIAEHVLKFAELEIKAQAIAPSRISEERTTMLGEILSSIKFFVADPAAPTTARVPRLHERVDQSLLATV